MAYAAGLDADADMTRWWINAAAFRSAPAFPDSPPARPDKSKCFAYSASFLSLLCKPAAGLQVETCGAASRAICGMRMPSAENPTKPNGVKSCKRDQPYEAIADNSTSSGARTLDRE